MFLSNSAFLDFDAISETHIIEEINYLSNKWRISLWEPKVSPNESGSRSCWELRNRSAVLTFGSESLTNHTYIFEG